jgi:hypothetical protein
MKVRILSSLLFGSAFIACASTPGAQPADMSAAQHDQAAGVHEAQATPHDAQYDPTAKKEVSHCGGNRNPCWTSEVNPTKEHLDEADKHRKMAADHRAASQALRDAESQACSGVPEDDRDNSPFSHREDITSVQPAYVHVSGKQAADKISGAVVTFRALPMLTGEWLQRVVDCHVARNNALGNDMPEMAYCPLEPKGITAKVSSAGGGFAVTIESQDPNTAQEVLRRSQALKNPG